MRTKSTSKKLPLRAAPSDQTLSTDKVSKEKGRGPAQGEEKLANRGGTWGQTSSAFAQGQIDQLKRSKRDLLDSICKGRVAIEIPLTNIDGDSIPSDRSDGWEHDQSFADLKLSIDNRGQLQPVKVRPKDPSWKPDDANPLKISGEFILQSGRRRLAAMRSLGKETIWAVLWAPGEGQSFKQSVEDLRERFDENTKRKDLSAWEKMLSIGELAEAMRTESPNIKSTTIANTLSVSGSNVSIGTYIFLNQERVLQHVDPNTVSENDLKALIPTLRNRKPKKAKSAPKPKPEPITVKRTGSKLTLSTGSQICVKKHGQIEVLNEAGQPADLDETNRILAMIEKAVTKAKIRET